LLLSSLIGMDSWLCYNDYLYVCERDFTGLLAGEVGPVLPDSKRGGAHPDYAPRAAYGSTDGGFALVGYSLSPPFSIITFASQHGGRRSTLVVLSRAGLDRAKVLRVFCCSSRGAPPIAVVRGARALCDW